MLKKIRDRWLGRFLVQATFFLGTGLLAYADNPAAPAGGTASHEQPGFGSMLVPLLPMFAVIYFLMIRPQQKKVKDQQQMLAALKHGDEVVTSSGILGTVTGITEKVVTVEIADDVRVKMLKSQVSQVVKGQIKDLSQ